MLSGEALDASQSLYKHGSSVPSLWILEATKAPQQSIDVADLIRRGLNLATAWLCGPYFKLMHTRSSFAAYFQSHVQKKITLLFYCSTVTFRLSFMSPDPILCTYAISIEEFSIPDSPLFCQTQCSTSIRLQ